MHVEVWSYYSPWPHVNVCPSYIGFGGFLSINERSTSNNSVNGVQLESFKPNILTIEKNQKNVFLKFILSSCRRNQAPEKFYFIPRTVDGINIKVIPASVVLSGCGDHAVVKVVITSIHPRVRHGQPYSVLLTATNKFTRLTDLYGILVEDQRVRF